MARVTRDSDMTVKLVPVDGHLQTDHPARSLLRVFGISVISVDLVAIPTTYTKRRVVAFHCGIEFQNRHSSKDLDIPVDLLDSPGAWFHVIQFLRTGWFDH